MSAAHGSVSRRASVSVCFDGDVRTLPICAHHLLHAPLMLANRAILVNALYPLFIGFEETSSYWSVQFFSAFHWSSSVDKPRMTSVSFVIRGFIGPYQSANFVWLRYPLQDYGVLRGLPMNHTRFGDWVTIWVVYLPEWTETVA